MALAECPKCESVVSTLVSECAHCGYPIARAAPPSREPSARGPASAPPPPDEDWTPEEGGMPLWAGAVFCLYAMVFVALVVGPAALGAIEGKPDALLAGCLTSAGLLLVGYSLMRIPIGRYWYTPPRQRGLALPLLASATCAAALVFGAGLASVEYFRIKGDEIFFAVCIGAGASWVAWLVLFLGLARSTDRDSAADQMYRWLLAGSVMELLVAVPMHLVVRRRDECCAGMYTGMGIGVGLVVLVLALGPAVLVLCYRRYNQVYAKRR